MNLTKNQIRVLESIPMNGKTYALEIAERSALTSQQVSPVVKALFYIGLFDHEQSKSDRGGPPKNDVWLTAAGRELKQELGGG